MRCVRVKTEVLLLPTMTVVACTAGHSTVDVSLHVECKRCMEEHAMGHDPGGGIYVSTVSIVTLH